MAFHSTVSPLSWFPRFGPEMRTLRQSCRAFLVSRFSVIGLIASVVFVLRDQFEVCTLSRYGMSTIPAGNVGGRYPGHYSRTFASSNLLYPQPCRHTLRWAFPVWPMIAWPRSGELRAYPVPSCIPGWFRFRLSAESPLPARA